MNRIGYIVVTQWLRPTIMSILVACYKMSRGSKLFKYFSTGCHGNRLRDEGFYCSIFLGNLLGNLILTKKPFLHSNILYIQRLSYILIFRTNIYYYNKSSEYKFEMANDTAHVVQLLALTLGLIRIF